MSAETFGTLDALPPDAAALFDTAGDFFATAAWWRTVWRAGLSDGETPLFLLCRIAGRPAALFALRRRGTALDSLTTPYTCLYAPLLAPGLDAAALRAVGRQLGRFCRGQAVVRLEALDAAAAALAPLLEGLRAAGLALARFDHFGNWHMPVRGLSWADYLQTRPGELRETIRRRMRRAEREKVAFEIVAAPDQVGAGIAEYEAVYARSWKIPEPFPEFNATLMREAAGIGALRLGLLRVGGAAIAVQLWVVWNGRAAVLKLAHDEAFKPLSPGTLLTALMIRELLDRERVAELDFGRGDDGYKQLWTDARRQRIGLLLIDPRRPAGLLALARQALGSLRRRARI